MNKIYSITEVVKKYNLSIHTLRYYEKIGLIKSMRNKSNYRVYSEEQLNVLDQVLLFRKMGISIKDIKAVFTANNKDDIIKIIADYKMHLKEEMSLIGNMRENIYAFLNQNREENSEADKLLSACTAKRTWEISLEAMEQAPSNEGKPKIDENGIAASSFVLYDEQEDVLRVSGKNECAISENEYAIPVIINIKVKMAHSQLYLYFGGYRAYFYKRDGGIRVWFHDYLNNCNLNMFDKISLPQDEYIDITWELLKHRTQIYIGDFSVFNLDYINNYDFELLSRISVGTDFNDTVTVKEINVGEEDSAVQAIDLSRMNWHQSEHHIEDNEMVFYSLFDRAALGTGQRFSLPLKIDLTAKIDDTNLRLYYGKGGVILNWESDKMLLRVNDVYNGHPYLCENKGYITPEEYHDISWVINREYTALVVDGDLRFYSEDFPYMEYIKDNPVRGDVRVSTAFGSTMTIKSLTVTELE